MSYWYLHPGYARHCRGSCAGGSGSFAILYGFHKCGYVVYAKVAAIVVAVQIAHAFGNWPTRRILHRKAEKGNQYEAITKPETR
jgi:hypothetical protein